MGEEGEAMGEAGRDMNAGTASASERWLAPATAIGSSFIAPWWWEFLDDDSRNGRTAPAPVKSLPTVPETDRGRPLGRRGPLPIPERSGRRFIAVNDSDRLA